MDGSLVVMVDSAQSVLAKLRNKAKQTGKSFQLHLQLFCQEEFLRRVSKSSYSNNLILKGGLFLFCLSGFESRPTMDIDFLLKNTSNSLNDVEAMVNEIIFHDTGNNFIQFEIRGVEPIAELREYSGVRVKIIGKIKTTKTPFDVDFGVGDVIVPKAEIKNIPTQLSGFDEPLINTYSLESTIAEKFDAIISRMELSSRMKDYYDIYYLANTYKFDARVLQEAIFETIQNRGTQYEKNTFSKVLKFVYDDKMNLKWRHFAKGLNCNIKLEEILNVLDSFLGVYLNQS